jgi:ketosteroid isomerase-like protein
MSSNLETAQQIHAAFGRGDVPAILAHMADDVAWESWTDNTAQQRGVPWLAPRSGKDGVAAFFQLIGTKTQVRDFQVLSFSAGEHTVAVEFVIELHYPETGRTARDEEMHLWTFNAQGKVTRLRHYTDTAKHLHTAGLA